MKKLHFSIILIFMVTLSSLVMFAVYRPAVAWSFVNSAIFLTVVGALIAAFSGTWGAQYLVERRELFKEIRNTNAAISLVNHIKATYMTAKIQHVRDLVAGYEQQRQYHHDNSGAKIQPNRTMFSPLFAPIDKLQTVLANHISGDGKVHLLATELARSINGFDHAVSRRNIWVEEFKMHPNEIIASNYFGFSSSEYADMRYPDLMGDLKK